MRVLAAALCAGLLAVAGADASEIAAGAVVHGDVVFLRSPGGLAAHAAATGASRWTVPEDIRPLAAHGSHLLGQAASTAGELTLVFLDTASGRRVGGDVNVVLPEGVSAPLDDTGETRFAIRVEQAGQQARLEWRWELRPMRGVFDEDDDGARRAEGAVLVDLDAERATPTAARAARGIERLPDAIAREADAGAFAERPLRIGRFFVATQRGASGAAVLKRWTELAAALPDVALPAGAALQMGSADGSHVLVSREVPGEPLERANEWTVVALDTGSPVATLRTSTAAAAFEVAAGRVLAVQQAWEHRTASGWQRDPRRLESFDGASGATAWAREVRDSAYGGPVAP